MSLYVPENGATSGVLQVPFFCRCDTMIVAWRVMGKNPSLTVK